MFLYYTKYLLLVVAITNASPHAIQPKHSKRAPTQNENITILDKMNESTGDLETPVHRECKFPPTSVLHDFSTFAFFEICNRKVPTHLTPHTPDEDVLCMGLYEIGVRLCRFATKFGLPVTSIPSKPSDFEELLKELHSLKSDSKLCSEFERLPMPQALESESEEDWNTLRMFKNNNQVCPHICFYIDGDAKELCKLILWGNTFMVNTTSSALSARHAETTAVKSIDVHSQGFSGIGVDQSSHGSQNALDPHLKDSSSPMVSSQDSSYNSQNVNPSKSEASSAIQKPGLGSQTMDSKHSAAANVPGGGSALEAVKVDHRQESLPLEHELPSARDEETKTRKSSVSSVENAMQPKTENTLHDSGVNKLEDIPKETKLVKPEETVKAITPVPSALLPVTTTTIVAPEVIVQDTASNPSIEANQETMGVEDFSKYDEPNLEQAEDEDMHFPAAAIDPPIKADESIIGDAEYQKPIGDNIKYVHERFEESEDSHFFRYFMTMVVFCIFGYLLFHNKQKILALFLEGRSRRGNRRRPNTANYHKLDSNLEEAVSSPCNTSVAHVIY